jgi:hypothetical protein
VTGLLIYLQITGSFISWSIIAAMKNTVLFEIFIDPPPIVIFSFSNQHTRWGLFCSTQPPNKTREKKTTGYSC